jgi:predicted MarR family transcription regulator
MTISIHDRNGTTANLATATLDNETTTWLNYEVQKLLKKRPTETTTESLTTTTSATPAATTTGTSP